MKIHYHLGCKSKNVTYKNVTQNLSEVTCTNCRMKIGKIIMDDGWGYLVCSECKMVSSPTYPLHDFYLDMYDEKEGYGKCKFCNNELLLKVHKEILDSQLSPHEDNSSDCAVKCGEVDNSDSVFF